MLNGETGVEFIFIEKPNSKQIDEITSLYKSAGWWTDSGANSDLVTGIVGGSHCFVLALSDGEVVGMGRAISDGVSGAYIQDVTVAQALRKKGIGLQIIKTIAARMKQDGLGWLGLIAERGSSPLYEKAGFRAMPDSTPMLKEES